MDTHLQILCGQLYHRYVRLKEGFRQIYSCRLQHYYGHEQQTSALPVVDTSAQAPIISPDKPVATGLTVMSGRRGSITISPGESFMFRDRIDADHGQPTLPRVEFNIDALLEYERQRSSVTYRENDPLTPAQRRRKAQNRAAYVAG
jgi:hypothetical protein